MVPKLAVNGVYECAKSKALPKSTRRQNLATSQLSRNSGKLGRGSGKLGTLSLSISSEEKYFGVVYFSKSQLS